MRTHLQRDLTSLTKKLLEIGALVEEAVKKATRAVAERDLALANQVIKGDLIVDRLEVEFEEDCLKVLALHAPVAADLRRVVGFLKVNNDLERIGDLAQNIAERAAFFATREPIEHPNELEYVAGRVRKMVRDCLDAMINTEIGLARQVLTDDEEVDSIHTGFYKTIEQLIAVSPDRGAEILQLLSLSRYYERIADQATNIAEDVIFMVSGEVIRHQATRYRLVGED